MKGYHRTLGDEHLQPWEIRSIQSPISVHVDFTWFYGLIGTNLTHALVPPQNDSCRVLTCHPFIQEAESAMVLHHHHLLGCLRRVAGTVRFVGAMTEDVKNSR